MQVVETGGERGAVAPQCPAPRRARSRPSLLAPGIGAIAMSVAGLGLSSEHFESIVLWTFNLFLAGLGVHQILTRRHPLFSVRNLFIVGFMVFQTQSAADSISLGYFGGVYIADPSLASRRFIGVSVIFLGIFFATYRLAVGQSGRIPFELPLNLPRARLRGCLARAGGLALLSLVLVYAIPTSNQSIRNAIDIAAVATAAAACGLVGWSWVHYPTNLIVTSAGVLTLIAAIPAALADQFGRRPVLTLLGSLLWSMYFSRWYTSHPGRALRWVAVGSVAALVPLALYTSARDPAEHNRSVRSQLSAISEKGSVVTGLESLRRDETTGAMTLWALENLGPGQVNRPPLQSLRYLVEIPIPRQLWPNKSVPLSKDFARLANVPNVSFERITIPAGILGSGWADGGWFAVMLYAGLLGALLGRVDRFLFRRRQDPVVVIALGSGFGQVLAFGRGETSILLAVFGLSVVVVAILLRILGIPSLDNASNQRRSIT